MSFSDATQNVSLAVESADALRSRPIASLKDGERASIGKLTYELDLFSLLPDDGFNVLATRPSLGNPAVPSRWILIDTGTPSPPAKGSTPVVVFRPTAVTHDNVYGTWAEAAAACAALSGFRIVCFDNSLIGFAPCDIPAGAWDLGDEQEVWFFGKGEEADPKVAMQKVVDAVQAEMKKG